MQKWEYHIYPWNEASGWSGDSGISGAKSMLNNFGSEGWELVNVAEHSGRTLFYFKRPLEEERSGVVW